MKCKKLHKKLIFFVNGDLSSEEEKIIQDHLNRCPECSAFVNELNRTLNIIEEEKSPSINPYFYTRLKARLENGEKPLREDTIFSPLLIRIIQPALFSFLLILGIYIGIKIGQPAFTDNKYTDTELFNFLNEMETEPLENFLME